MAVPAIRSFAETAQILAARGLFCLLQGDYATAAELILQVQPNVPDSRIGAILADRDIALCGTLCALASLPPAQISQRLLCDEFEKFLEQADPIVRELICDFVAGNFGAVEASLDAIAVRVAYDPFLCDHRLVLVELIRSRCLRLIRPFLDNQALLSVHSRARAAASVDSARFRCDPLAAAAELDAVKARSVKAQKAASRAVARSHEEKEDDKSRARMRNVFSRAAATGIAQDRFKQADADTSGTVDVNELEEIAEALGHKLSPQQLRRVVDEVDVDGNGELDCEFSTSHLSLLVIFRFHSDRRL